jgi:hypothetical protein
VVELTGTEVDWPEVRTAFVPEEEAGPPGGTTLEADQATPIAARTPIAQKANVIKKRRVKKADLETVFFFIRRFVSVNPVS